MFKSIFVKYISAFMLSNILSIFLSTSIITTLVNTFDENNKTRNLAKVNYAAASYMIDDYTASGEISFGDYLEESVYEIIPVLDTIALSEDDLLIFVADGDGSVRMVRGVEHAGDFAGEDGIITDGEELILPQSVVSELKKADSLSRYDDLDGFFDGKYLSYLQPIVASEGKTVGMVMTCTMSTDMDELLEAMIRTIVMSMLWLMLASLIAVYFITERLVSPIRAMSKASREFAAGQFDVRVQVNGNDEVAELADAFNNMASSLQHSEESRRLFLANVSHDLRTPMTTIRGYIDSILSGVIKQDMIPHYLEVISGEVQRLSRLVSSLLDITRIQAGERKFSNAPFDICEMAREIIIFSEQRLEDKKLDVEFDADKDNMFVGGDREAIHQVLSNICDNAIKFSRQGGKYIVSVKDIGAKTEISVYNEGDGIPEEDLPYVFDRFYKGDKSRGLDKTGVGLGLYISRTIIEAHREKIWVESEYGKWCRFTFTMPRVNNPKSTTSRETEN